MSLDEIPKLSFAERQELVCRAIALDEESLTLEEHAVLDARMADFDPVAETGIPLNELRERAHITPPF